MSKDKVEKVRGPVAGHPDGELDYMNPEKFDIEYPIEKEEEDDKQE
jgi:hypothetical protein